jgi:murein L,D-transpeptidase YcbB/YkuD
MSPVLDRVQGAGPTACAQTPLCVVSRIRAAPRISHLAGTVNAGLTGESYAWAVVAADSMRKPMDAQRIAVDAIVALTDCDRDAVTAFIRRLYLAGVKDPKRLTFKGLQAMARA